MTSFFVPALLLSILTPLFLHSSSASLCYFMLYVPIRKCLGKHLCMSSSFPIVILNGPSLLWPKLRVLKSNQTKLEESVFSKILFKLKISLSVK